MWELETFLENGWDNSGRGHMMAVGAASSASHFVCFRSLSKTIVFSSVEPSPRTITSHAVKRLTLMKT